MTVSQVSAGRKNQLKLEIAGSELTFAWNSEKANELWIGRRDSANELLMRDPSIVHEESRNIISFPGGHNEGFMLNQHNYRQAIMKVSLIQASRFLKRYMKMSGMEDLIIQAIQHSKMDCVN